MALLVDFIDSSGGRLLVCTLDLHPVCDAPLKRGAYEKANEIDIASGKDIPGTAADDYSVILL